MAAESGRDAPSLKDELFAHADRFEFEQAVRLLARLYPQRDPVGGDADPRDELVRFTSDLSAVFPKADLQAAELPHGDEAARLRVCFMGIATPASFGSLPRRYAEEIRSLVRDKNTALRDFIDLFNHRLVSLFFRARERHQPAILFERGPANPLERALAAVLGVGTRGLADRMVLPDRALFARAGLLAMRPMPALALEALLSSVFSAPIAVQQFRAARYRIESGDQNRIGLVNSRLGDDLVLGEEILLVDSKFRVRVGPVGWSQFEALLPDQAGFQQLADLLRFATRSNLDFDVQVLLAAEEVPSVRLAAGSSARGRLGWSSWLGGAGSGAPREDAVFTPFAKQSGQASSAQPRMEKAA